MKAKTLTGIIGYTPGAIMKKMILADVQASGISIEEAASKYSLPVMVVPSDRGLIHENGVTMTVAEFEAMYPFRRIIIIREDI